MGVVAEADAEAAKRGAGVPVVMVKGAQRKGVRAAPLAMWGCVGLEAAAPIDGAGSLRAGEVRHDCEYGTLLVMTVIGWTGGVHPVLHTVSASSGSDMIGLVFCACGSPSFCDVCCCLLASTVRSALSPAVV